MNMLKALSVLSLSVALAACEGGSSSSTSNTSSGSSSRVADSMVGYWKGSSLINGETINSFAFVGESGFTFISVEEKAVVYGDLNFSGTNGTGVLTEIDGGTVYKYSSALSLSGNSLTANVSVSGKTATFTGTADAANNSEFKASRSLSSFNGTWYQYAMSSSDTFTMTAGKTTFRSLDTNCLLAVILEDKGYSVSEFQLTATATECTDMTLNGSYKGVAASGKDGTTETFTLFAYNDKAWIGGDFKRQ